MFTSAQYDMTLAYDGSVYDIDLIHKLILYTDIQIINSITSEYGFTALLLPLVLRHTLHRFQMTVFITDACVYILFVMEDIPNVVSVSTEFLVIDFSLDLIQSFSTYVHFFRQLFSFHLFQLRHEFSMTLFFPLAKT